MDELYEVNTPDGAWDEAIFQAGPQKPSPTPTPDAGTPNQPSPEKKPGASALWISEVLFDGRGFVPVG